MMEKYYLIYYGMNILYKCTKFGTFQWKIKEYNAYIVYDEFDKVPLKHLEKEKELSQYEYYYDGPDDHKYRSKYLHIAMIICLIFTMICSSLIWILIKKIKYCFVLLEYQLHC